MTTAIPTSASLADLLQSQVEAIHAATGDDQAAYAGMIGMMAHTLAGFLGDMIGFHFVDVDLVMRDCADITRDACLDRVKLEGRELLEAPVVAVTQH